MQARAAGAVAPTAIPAAQASAYDATTDVMANTATNTAAGSPVRPPTSTQVVPHTTAARAPDAIDAAADAFEPPPPASIAERQARQAQRTEDPGGSVQLMRASTASHGMPAPTQSNDDPIARFANGNY